ncbi:MAG: hypothetical protein IT198_04505 [Acidimicrobiia bacterium]|nr:hypothetical protein [Acidimicrobiia bacterium]
MEVLEFYDLDFPRERREFLFASGQIGKVGSCQVLPLLVSYRNVLNRRCAA